MGILDVICHTMEFRRSLERNRARLYRIAYSWCRNAAVADDVVQDTMIKALRHQRQLRDLQAMDAWLFSILANCYRDHFRRHRDTEDIDDLELPADDTPETEHTQNQVIAMVHTAIAALPEGQRQVLTLVDLEGFSYTEVAQILSIPTGTVMSRLCRGRNLLKQLLLPVIARHSKPDTRGIWRVK
ncbi:MAG: RNA polymerase sigma factor [Acidiferrobacteraceae bacterium]